MDIPPHPVETFKFSTDPQLEAKLRDVSGSTWTHLLTTTAPITHDEGSARDDAPPRDRHRWRDGDDRMVRRRPGHRPTAESHDAERPHSRAVLNVVSPQHSGTLTASPPSDVSLYLLCMSIPVCRIVSIA